MDNPEKLTTLGTQDEEQQSKNTTQYVLDTTIGRQTQITEIRHCYPTRQVEVRRMDHRCYTKFVTDITTRNSKGKVKTLYLVFSWQVEF